MHYARLRKRGTTELPPPLTLAEKLAARLVAAGECLVWDGARSDYGYGHIVWEGKVLNTHKVAWELAHGPVAERLLVCHHCDNPPCCRVEHLFLGTKSINALDCIDKGRPWPRKRLRPETMR